MFRLTTDDALELGHALLDAVEFIAGEHDGPIAVERHDGKAVAVPEYVAGENTIVVVDP